jgi:NAD(P)-dependent dehydrogenase (short-subunit alcohol dehydrogenase family)
MAGKVVLVTGAGSGIGRAVALGFLGHGDAVVLAGRRRAALEDTAALAGPGARSLIAPADVADPDSVTRLFDSAAAAFGRLDVLFNNAGRGAAPTPFEDITLATWNAVVAVNLTGAFLCAQHAVRLMKAQDPRGGRIINNGSISAHSPRPGSAPYTATKHAVTGLTRSIALDGRAHGIACGQIDIGNAATALTTAMSQGVSQADGRVVAEPVMDVAAVVEAVLMMAALPLSANVQFMTVMATAMPYIGRG